MLCLAKGNKLQSPNYYIHVQRFQPSRFKWKPPVFRDHFCPPIFTLKPPVFCFLRKRVKFVINTNSLKSSKNSASNTSLLKQLKKPERTVKIQDKYVRCGLYK